MDKSRIICIIDRSGSMASVRDEAVNGFKVFIEGQKVVPGDVKVSLVRFDDKYESVFTDLALNDVPELDLEPRGMTALYDAIGRTVSEAKIGKRRTFVLTVTDGHENASREWTMARLRSLIEERKAAGWEFIFVGTTEEAMASAQAMGVPVASSFQHDGSGTAVRDSYVVTNASLTAARVTGKSFTYEKDDADA